MNEIDTQQADAVAGGQLNFFLLTLLGPNERVPAIRDSMAAES